MAFDTTSYLPVSRQKHMNYYETVDGPTASNCLSVVFSPGDYEIDKIRVRLSSVHASVVDFTATMIHHKGSYYNRLFLSTAMNGIQDAVFSAFPTLVMHYGDSIQFSMVMSAANVAGIEVSGWAITGA